jgi:hypothetical protein
MKGMSLEQTEIVMSADGSLRTRIAVGIKFALNGKFSKNILRMKQLGQLTVLD